MTVGSNTESCTLIPVNLHNPSEFETLRTQRVACGWSSEPSTIIIWRQMMDDNLKSPFWITLPHDIRAGHISLDSDSERDSSGKQIEPDLASADRTVMTITAFFISPEYRSGGLGRRAMDLVEEYATKEPYGSPHCRMVTLHTLSRRYFEDDGPDWKGIWARMGWAVPRSNEVWYLRRGYVKWKETPKYEAKTKDGEEIVFMASFLKKEIQPCKYDQNNAHEVVARDKA